MINGTGVGYKYNVIIDAFLSEYYTKNGKPSSEEEAIIATEEISEFCKLIKYSSKQEFDEYFELYKTEYIAIKKRKRRHE